MRRIGDELDQTLFDQLVDQRLDVLPRNRARAGHLWNRLLARLVKAAQDGPQSACRLAAVMNLIGHYSQPVKKQHCFVDQRVDGRFGRLFFLFFSERSLFSAAKCHWIFNGMKIVIMTSQLSNSRRLSTQRVKGSKGGRAERGVEVRRRF